MNDQEIDRSSIQGKSLADMHTRCNLLQVIILIFIIPALVCITIPNLRNKSLYDLEWWKWDVMFFIVICGRLVSGWAIQIIVFFIEQSFLLHKRGFYLVYHLKQQVQSYIWLGLIWIAWQFICDNEVQKKVLLYANRIWICALVGTTVWLFKDLLVEVISSDFHVSKFFDRIRDSLINQYVIKAISGLPVLEIPQEEEEAKLEEGDQLQLKANIFKSSKSKGTLRPSTALADIDGITIEHLQRMTRKNISIWNMNRMINVIRTTMLTTLDHEASTQITNENQATTVAEKIFRKFAKSGSKHIYFEDLRPFLGNNEALKKSIRFFDRANETKGITEEALKHWVVNVFRERIALALSLDDTKTIMNKLHQMLNVVVGIIIIVASLLIVEVETTNFFKFLCSVLVLVSIVFGGTCKTTFEALIFFFIVHPFDVGDRCEIDGVQMTVDKMNILTTVFLRHDNQKIVYPTSVLSTMSIANYYRSPYMGDVIDFCIHESTSKVKATKMKEMITSYVENKSEHWQPGPKMLVRDAADMNQLKISLCVSHCINFQDTGERLNRRAALVNEMIKIFKDLGIEYRMLPMKINAGNLPALSSNRFPSNWTKCTI